MSSALIKGIESELAAAALRCWPQLATQPLAGAVQFYPQPDAARGELYSDFCFLLARILKISPLTIGNALVGESIAEPGVAISCDAGFLNVRVESSLLNGLSARCGSGAILIALPNPSRSFCGWAGVRLAARGALQYCLAAACSTPATLMLGDEVVAGPGADLTDTWDKVVRRVVDAPEIAPAEPDFVFLDQQTVKQSCRIATGWSMGELLHGSFERSYRNVSVAADGRVHVLMCPAKLWFAGADGLGDLRSVLSWSPARRAALLVYLSSDLRAEDLDLSVTELAEFSNLRWTIRTTLARLEMLKLPSVVERYSQVEPFEGHVGLSRSLALLGFFLESGITVGQVSEFLAAITETLSGLQRMLNTPQVRSRWVHGHVSPEESQIVSGAATFFSTMMKGYPFSFKSDTDSGSYE